MLLKVSHWKSDIRFQTQGKLGLKFIGPSRIIARVGKVEYRLDLPHDLSQIHNNFNVSQHRECLADDSIVLPLDDIQVDDRLNYIESPIAILDRKMKTMCKKVVGLVKVQWQYLKGSLPSRSASITSKTC